MKHGLIALIASAVLAGFAMPSYASDWDKAGKILTGIEGVRVLSGGRVDIIGAITGLNNNNRGQNDYYGYGNRYGDGYGECVTTKVWVPQVVWEEEWVPTHREFRPRVGWVIVPGHYERYQVSQGGYWVEQQSRPYQRTSFRTHYR